MLTSVDVIENYLSSKSLKSIDDIDFDNLFEIRELLNKHYSVLGEQYISNNSLFVGSYYAINHLNPPINESLSNTALYSEKLVLTDNIYSWFSESKYKFFNRLPENDSKIHANFKEKRSFNLLVNDNSISNDDKLKISIEFIKNHLNYYNSIKEYIHNNSILLIPYYDLIEKYYDDIRQISDYFKKSVCYQEVNKKINDEYFENNDEIAFMNAKFSGYMPGVKPGDKAIIPQFQEIRAFYTAKNLVLSKIINAHYCPLSKGNSALLLRLLEILSEEINYHYKTDLAVTKLLFYSDLPHFHSGTLKDAMEIRHKSESFNEWQHELRKIVNSTTVDFNSKKEVKAFSNDLFSPIVNRMKTELQKSKHLQNFLSKEDLFSFIGGFIGGYYSSNNDIKTALVTGSLNNIVLIAGKIFTGYGKPKVQGMDNIILSILRHKDKKN